MMTKLLNNVRIVNTGQKEYLHTPVSFISAELKPDENVIYDQGYIYSVDVKLGMRQIISDEDFKKYGDEILHHTRKRVGSVIAEEVYGELRKELIELNTELRSSPHYYNSSAHKRVEKMLRMIAYDG